MILAAPEQHHAGDTRGLLLWGKSTAPQPEPTRAGVGEEHVWNTTLLLNFTGKVKAF